MRAGPGMVSGVLPDGHPLPGSDPPHRLCASCLSPLVHSFRVFTFSPRHPHPSPPSSHPQSPWSPTVLGTPHPHSFLFFYFCSKLWRWLLRSWGASGEGSPPGRGWGRDYCSEHPVPRGACVERVSGQAGTGDTQPHKHTGHSMGGGAGGEAGRRIALWEWGQVGTPSNWSLGGDWKPSVPSPLWRGR